MEFFKQIQKRGELCNEPPGCRPSFDNFFFGGRLLGVELCPQKRVPPSPDSRACAEVALPGNAVFAGAGNSSEMRPDCGRAA